MAGELGLLVQYLLYPRPGHQSLHPSPVIGVVIFHLGTTLIVAKDEWNHRFPRDKCDVGVGTLVSHEIFFALECRIKYGIHADDLFLIPVLCRLKLLVMEMNEPGNNSVMIR